MKKVLSFILVIGIYLHPLAKATHQDIIEETNLTKNSRNWEHEAKRFGYGILSLGASYLAASVISYEDIPDALNVVSTYYITTSLMTLGRYCLEWYGESLAKAQQMPTKRKNNFKTSAKLDQATQENTRRIQVTLRQTQSLINAALKIGALYTLSQHYIPEELGQVLGYASLLTGGLLYNLNELMYTYTTGQTRHDIPLLGILDGACEAMLATKIYSEWGNRPMSQWLEQEIEIRPGIFLVKHQAFSSAEWAFYRFLQMHGDTQAIRGLFQIPTNFISGIRTYLKQQPHIIEPHIDKELSSTLPTKRRQGAPSPEPSLPINSISPSMLPLKESSSLSPSLTTAEEHFKEKRKKVKRKGIPGLAFAEAASSSSQETPVAEPSERDIKRHEALNRIQEDRKKTLIKKADIDKEIGKLCQFLTNARLENIGHGKQAIILEFAAGKSFRLIFEPPHEQSAASSDEYKGYRKTRVLDALQVGYLHGWSETEILNFMEAHGINRFYNLPAFLLHILWDRGAD